MERTGRPGCPPFFAILLGRHFSVEGGGDDREQDAGEGDDKAVRVISLADFHERIKGGITDGGRGSREDGSTTNSVVFGFVDPSSEPGGAPGCLLRNFLALLSAKWGLSTARVLCFREFVPRATTDEDDAPVPSPSPMEGDKL